MLLNMGCTVNINSLGKKNLIIGKHLASNCTGKKHQWAELCCALSGVCRDGMKRRSTKAGKTLPNGFVWFQMLNLKGRSKAKKHSAGEALDEQESKSLVIATEMDRLRINTEEEEEEAADGRKSRRESLQSSGEDALHQKSFSFLLEHQEEETDVDEIPQEKSVRWTDLCQRDARGLKEKVRAEERIKHQLFSGVCWQTGHKAGSGSGNLVYLQDKKSFLNFKLLRQTQRYPQCVVLGRWGASRSSLLSDVLHSVT